MVTFPVEEKVPEASVFVVFTGEGVPNILRTERINEHTVAAIAPGWPAHQCLSAMPSGLTCASSCR